MSEITRKKFEEVERRKKRGLEKAIAISRRYTGITGVAYIRDERGRERWVTMKNYLMMRDAGRKVKLLAQRKTIAGMNVSDLERLAEEKRKEEQQIKTELKKAEDEFEKRRKDLAFQNAIARIISPIEVTLYKEEIKASNAGKLMLVRDLRKARDLIKGIKEELEKGMY